MPHDVIEEYISESHNLNQFEDEIDIVTHSIRGKWLQNDRSLVSCMIDHHNTHRDVDPDKEPLIWRIDTCHMIPSKST